MVETSTKRKRLPSADRRALILEAAGRLFAERGYQRARLEDVALAAGVTKPVLYRHFDSKAALYLGLLERHRDDLQAFVGLIPPPGPLVEGLRTVLEAWFSYVEAHAYAWKMLFRDSGGGPEIDAFRRDLNARAREVLADAIQALGEQPIAAPEAQAIAELMRMGMAGLALWWIDDPGASREAIIDAMTRTWAGLLRRTDR